MSQELMVVLHYPVLIAYESEEYVARFRDLPDLEVGGATRGWAMLRAEEALLEERERYAADRMPFPLPSCRGDGEGLVALVFPSEHWRIVEVQADVDTEAPSATEPPSTDGDLESRWRSHPSITSWRFRPTSTPRPRQPRSRRRRTETCAMAGVTLVLPGDDISDDNISFLGGRLPTLLGCVHEGLGTAYWYRTGCGEIIRVLMRAFPTTQYVVAVLDGGALLPAVAGPGWRPAGSFDRRTRARALSLLPPCRYPEIAEPKARL